MNTKNWVISIAILVLTIFVVLYGIDAIYPAPNYDNYCSELPVKQVNTSVDCEKMDGKWVSFNVENDLNEGYCDMYYYCRTDYESSREVYSKNVFLISVVLGILLILVGIFLLKLEYVSVGLMGGGIGTLLFGVGGYWRYADSWLKFGASLIALAILIFVTYYINNPKRFKKRK